MEKYKIRISVRTLVEFMMRSGDIDNRRTAAVDNAMAEGSRIHRMIQRRMGSDYQAEVVLKHKIEFPEYTICIEGRADGIFKEQNQIFVDEIKSTYRDIAKMKEAVFVHVAQAKCYAYIYALQNKLMNIGIRMTYCNIDTEEIRHFDSHAEFEELEIWFTDLIAGYQKWTDYQYAWGKTRQNAIKELEFPFPYREGQKELVSDVYRTIYHKKKLFLEAPTGVGKTISTMFPAIKAIGEGMGDKLFYLTAKTITRTVASDTFSLLQEHGLKFKSVVITAKEKICPLQEMECNPVACPCAKGHYDRVNEAVFDMMIHEDVYTREVLEQYALKYQVCPFELCLDISLFSDGIICDYNYLFDPHVYLKRFFAEGNEGDYLFLIDEAHNLLERGRDMYSAKLIKEDFLKLKRVIKLYDTRMEKQLEKCNRELLSLKRECENYKLIEYIDSFVTSLMRLYATMDNFLEKQDDNDVRKEVLEFYFEIGHFLDIYERVDDNYVMYTEMLTDGNFMLKLFCVNPSVSLKECMGKGRSTILFSATLLPIQYYKRLLGGEQTDYEVYAKSNFNPEKKALFIGSDVTSKYARRTDMEYYNIAFYIHEIIKQRMGNYMIFFPSHAFLKDVLFAYEQYFHNEEEVECLIQMDFMNEEKRETFLQRFSGNESCDLSAHIHIDIEIEEEKTLLGFCVMGGIFSEGIDLKNDSLIGAIIVGTGIPQVCYEREILKNYFDEKGESGFDYAYRYPGMNKVLQAAGRVIRTTEDVGIVALLDERFTQFMYQKMFPKEWEHFEVVTIKQITKRVERFWNEWL